MTDIESFDTDRLTCPYYRGIRGASCVSGCREEPSCQTDQPLHGWRPRNRQGRFMRLTNEQLDAIAQERWDEHRKRYPELFKPSEPIVTWEQRTFGFDIERSGVYQAMDGKWHAYLIAGKDRTRAEGDTERDAHLNLLDQVWFTDRFWWEKWALMRDGDRTPRMRHRNVLRIDGWHYIPRSIDRMESGALLGFGGRVLRWRWLDEPEGVAHFSNDVMTQGVIPEKMRHLLTDNAVWVTSERGA